ncbi:hypothetical protein [Legionella rubrilucens]|uniref:hypothetical protein n=1 Tax=Legionella rubrilucens TaxID=458 RepID=UPI001055EB11|nr:hypothetical protein [Legionella rubrilucens]
MVARLRGQDSGWFLLPAQAGIQGRGTGLNNSHRLLSTKPPHPRFEWLPASAGRTAGGLSCPRRRASREVAQASITAIACLVPSLPIRASNGCPPSRAGQRVVCLAREGGHQMMGVNVQSSMTDSIVEGCFW